MAFSGGRTPSCHDLPDAEGLEELEVSRLHMLRDATPATLIAEIFSMLLSQSFQSCLSRMIPVWLHSWLPRSLNLSWRASVRHVLTSVIVQREVQVSLARWGSRHVCVQCVLTPLSMAPELPDDFAVCHSSIIGSCQRSAAAACPTMEGHPQHQASARMKQ